jgi:NADH-quinone oxidoreductase subunit M
MREALLHLPWLTLALAVPALGAVVVGTTRSLPRAAQRCLLVLAISIVCCLFVLLGFYGHDHGADSVGRFLLVDSLSAPLLPAISLIHLLVGLGTARAKMGRFSFAGLCLSQALAVALLTCQDAWLLIGLLAADALLPLLDMRARGSRLRPYLIYMVLFVGLLTLGWAMGSIVLCLIALLLRNATVPLHGWLSELFENASLGIALPVFLSFGGVLGVVRLVLPVAPENLLGLAAGAALLTAVYGGVLALVARDPQRFFSYLCMSQAALVLYGVLHHSTSSLTAALCLWISSLLALAGLGFILRALGARFGSLSLGAYHGLYGHAPGLAICFLFTGLASVGFPGTVGFVPLELLLSSTMDEGLVPALVLALAAMLNGIAVLRVYFQLFTGKRIAPSVPLPITRQERIAIVLLALAIFVGGFFPQPGVLSRHHAADEILAHRMP